MTTISSVSIIVLCYNGLEETTRPCLQSIVLNTNENDCELIIVDNGSVDGTVEYLKNFAVRYTNVRLHLNDRNKGYAAGNNDGMKLAQGKYIILLNNDTLVSAGWLEALLRLFKEQSSVGLIGPVTNSAGNEQRIDLDGLNEISFAKISDAYIKRQKEMWFTTERLGFFCVAIRRKVIDKIGFLDENFGVGMFEDDDYCLRATKAGFTLAIVEDCFVYHKGSVSFGKLDIESYRSLFEKNRNYFRKKHCIEWTLTDIAFSYCRKFNQDLLAEIKNNKKITSEIERILIRFEHFKHLLKQIHRVELSNAPDPIPAASIPYRDSKWKNRWSNFKRHMVHGTYREKKRYLLTLPGRVMNRYFSQKMVIVSHTAPVPEVVLYQLNIIREALKEKTLIIFPATVDFHYMTQRPQHLARAFSDAGYVVIYGTLNQQMDKVDVTELVTDNLYLLNEHYFHYLTYVFKPEKSIYYCLWPNNVKHLEYLPYSYLIYDYMDELSLLELPENELERDHKIILNQANLVTVSADKLMRQLPEEILSKALLVNNAVSQEFINAVNAEALSCSADSCIKMWSRDYVPLGDRFNHSPILGYYGAIAEWLDFDLIEHLAKNFCEARIVLIGPIVEKVSKRVMNLLWNYSNIVVLPPCTQLELIPFLNQFDVCLLPFIKNTVTDSVSPVKLFEYFAAGKPIVTTNLDECVKYASVRTANSHFEFVDLVRQSLLDNHTKLDEVAQKIALNNTWAHRIQHIESKMKVRGIF